MADLTPEELAAIQARIVAAASEPSAAAQDGRSATNQPIPDLIELDRYASGKAATSGGKSGWGCVRMARGVPPGST